MLLAHFGIKKIPTVGPGLYIYLISLCFYKYYPATLVKVEIKEKVKPIVNICFHRCTKVIKIG